LLGQEPVWVRKLHRCQLAGHFHKTEEFHCNSLAAVAKNTREEKVLMNLIFAIWQQKVGFIFDKIGWGTERAVYRRTAQKESGTESVNWMISGERMLDKVVLELGV
jgi:hypothetical protein